MAITTGPLFSLEASGTVGKTVTYSHWKGRSYVRRRVIPLNPFSADQVAARNRIRTMAEGMTWAQNTALKRTPPGTKDKTLIIALTPDGFAWNGFLADKGIGAGFASYTAAAAAYAALTAGEKTAWVTAAAALVPAIKPVPQGAAGGGFGTSLTAGDVFFHYMWALYEMALVAIPGATPPTYA